MTVNTVNNSPEWWVNACVCKGYSHFSEEHVVGVIGGGERLQVSLQLQQLPLHLPEALFQILCRHWHTQTYINTHTHTHRSTPTCGEKYEENRKKDHSITGTIKCIIIIFSLWKNQRKTAHKNWITRKMREKAAQLQRMLIMVSHSGSNTMGINNDGGEKINIKWGRVRYAGLLFFSSYMLVCMS